MVMSPKTKWKEIKEKTMTVEKAGTRIHDGSASLAPNKSDLFGAGDEEGAEGEGAEGAENEGDEKAEDEEGETANGKLPRTKLCHFASPRPKGGRVKMAKLRYCKAAEFRKELIVGISVRWCGEGGQAEHVSGRPHRAQDSND